MLGGLETEHDSKGNRWELYEEKGRWRWRRFGEKDRVVEESDMDYGSKDNCETNAKAHGMDGDFFKLM